jgi:hypothetical protein
MDSLEKYMFTNERLELLQEESFQQREKEKAKEREAKEREAKEREAKERGAKERGALFFPREKDSLFWCFYIIKHGFSKYEFPKTTSFENEKREKFALIEFLRTKKQVLKDKKIKNIREDIEDELANKEKIGMKTFLALCIAENINVLFIHKRKCFHLSNELEKSEKAEYHVIHQKDHQKYAYELNTTPEKCDDYITNYFQWETLDKPLKAFSSYKLSELLDICKKMVIPLPKDKKIGKKELYELILFHI